MKIQDISKKIPWVKWERVCVSKEPGGGVLGIRNMKEFYHTVRQVEVEDALRQGESESLWCKILRSKYGEGKG